MIQETPAAGIMGRASSRRTGKDAYLCCDVYSLEHGTLRGRCQGRAVHWGFVYSHPQYTYGHLGTRTMNTPRKRPISHSASKPNDSSHNDSLDYPPGESGLFPGCFRGAKLAPAKSRHRIDSFRAPTEFPLIYTTRLCTSPFRSRQG